MNRAMRLTRVAGFLCLAVAATLAAALGSTHGVTVREHLYDAKVLPTMEAWAGGAFGSIFHSSDCGRTWQRQPTPTDQQLFGIDMASAQVGWAVGRAGTILHTADGGASWHLQPPNTDRHFFKVLARSQNEAWVIGDWGAIFHTADGGSHWTDRSLSEDVILNDITFADRERGWIAGEAGAIFATTDGGATWSRQETGTEKTLFGIKFVDAQNGWAVGLDGLMLQTTDGGNHWEVRRGDPNIGSLEQMGFLEALKNPSLYAIDIVGNFGVAVGDMGMILVSTDGGRTWNRQEVPATWRLYWLRSLSLIEGKNGLVVGSSGLAIPILQGDFSYPGL